ncbi:MAG: GNAT family N-acetyltransferase [Gemmatimonadota bacterium]|nr:GNAT family N-acetyltransferase [Gemmatimonadota bacterium]
MSLPISTARLVLRPLRRTDLAAFLSYRSDPEVARYQSWEDISRAAATAFLRAQAKPSLSAPGVWQQIGIARVSTDQLIGDIGLLLREDGRSAEMGFTVAREHQGIGLAREALTGLFGVLLSRQTLERLDAVIDARNVRALRLVERLGFELRSSAEVLFKGAPCTEHTLTLSRAAWAASQAVAAHARGGRA